MQGNKEVIDYMNFLLANGGTRPIFYSFAYVF